MAMAGIKEAVEWIARNDDVDIGSPETGFIISVLLVSDLYRKTPEEIAERVIAFREKHQ